MKMKLDINWSLDDDGWSNQINSSKFFDTFFVFIQLIVFLIEK